MSDYKKKIEESNIKMKALAEAMGISRQSLWAKVNGHKPFTRSEMFLLDNLLEENGTLHVIRVQSEGDIRKKYVETIPVSEYFNNVGIIKESEDK